VRGVHLESALPRRVVKKPRHNMLLEAALARTWFRTPSTMHVVDRARRRALEQLLVECSTPAGKRGDRDRHVGREAQQKSSGPRPNHEVRRVGARRRPRRELQRVRMSAQGQIGLPVIKSCVRSNWPTCINGVKGTDTVRDDRRGSRRASDSVGCRNGREGSDCT